MQYPCVRQILANPLWVAAILASAIFVLTLTPLTAQAQTYNVVYTFPGGSNGYSPSGTIVGPNGTIYGIAGYDTCACSFIFSLANGKLTVLQRFSEPSGHDPDSPQGLLLNKASNMLYGTTQFGGHSNANCVGWGIGCGRVISYDLTNSQYNVLHAFYGKPDGSDPSGTQVLGANNTLFGLTWGGGQNGWGSFYRVNPSGGEEILYSFKNSPDGQGPGDGPVFYNGAFYGITIGGGSTDCMNGCGTIFKVTPTGSESVLYSFTGGADGENPYQIIGDGQGNFYGISRNNSNVVVAVFKITASGQFSIAYNGSFVSQIQSIIAGPNGSLYGTASGGNSSCTPNGCGQVFQLTPTGNGNGTVTILHQFDGADGALPQIGSLVLHNGVLVGSTAIGGSTNQGVIYELKP